MKNGNLYQEVKSVKKDERVAWAKRIEMELTMEKEVEEATRLIKEKYEPILKELEKETSEKNRKVLRIAGIYHDYGRFFTCDIVNMIAVFLSYIEGEKYIPFSSSKVLKNSIIIKEKVSKKYGNIDYDTLDMLYKNGYLIMLDDRYSNMVDFYNYVGVPNYRFGQFNYLREFVNRLIQYRIDNGKRDNITEDDLYSFMCEFILTHSDLAMKNKDKREQMLIGICEEEPLLSQCKKLERKLNNKTSSY